MKNLIKLIKKRENQEISLRNKNDYPSRIGDRGELGIWKEGYSN